MQLRSLLLGALGALALGAVACGDDDASDAAPVADASTQPDARLGPDAYAPRDASNVWVDLRVATWNVHDLFDELDVTSGSGSQDDVFTQAEVNAKLADIATALRRVDADIVFFQEVENFALISRLVGTQLADQGYTDMRLIEAFDPRGIDIGVISRRPITAYVSHLGEKAPDNSYLWSRDCTETHVVLEGREVIFLNNHLISQADNNDLRRSYQAQGIRTIADNLLSARPDRLVGVVGDLNDSPSSDALDPLYGDGVWTDVGLRLASGNQWTYESSGGSKSILDHIAVRQVEGSWVTNVSIDGGAGTETSDHRIVIADFRFPGLL